MSKTAHTPRDRRAAGGKASAGLVVAAIGVVFGDIGTSPLYTVKQAFGPHYGLSPTHDTVIGLLSLVFWALMLVVTIKYVTIIMRADNEGEGGIMALMTLAQRTLRPGSRSTDLVGILGIFGASLFCGDGVITPAISVLSAVEGLSTSSTAGDRRWISSMNSTSCGCRLVSSAARSPAFSITGPEVTRSPTPSSLAMTWLRVVLPRPGGPKISTWSMASPRARAASID